MLIARTQKRSYVTYTVENKKIRSTETIKYLGVTIHALLSFKQHLLDTGLKASNMAQILQCRATYRQACCKVALSVITGISPIDLLIDEGAEKYHGGVEDSDLQQRHGKWSRLKKNGKGDGFCLGESPPHPSRHPTCIRVNQ